MAVISDRCDKCQREAKDHPLGLFCCPLCGSEADMDHLGEFLMTETDYPAYVASPRVRIRCMAACCEIALVDLFEERAIARWNCRDRGWVKFSERQPEKGMHIWIREANGGRGTDIYQDFDPDRERQSLRWRHWIESGAEWMEVPPKGVI